MLISFTNSIITCTIQTIQCLIDWFIDFNGMPICRRLFHALNDMKYSYLIQIICTQLNGFKFSSLIPIIIVPSDYFDLIIYNCLHTDT